MKFASWPGFMEKVFIVITEINCVLIGIIRIIVSRPGDIGLDEMLTKTQS